MAPTVAGTPREFLPSKCAPLQLSRGQSRPLIDMTVSNRDDPAGIHWRAKRRLLGQVSVHPCRYRGREVLVVFAPYLTVERRLAPLTVTGTVGVVRWLCDDAEKTWPSKRPGMRVQPNR